jgi:putative restriction endonuclease
VGFGVFIHRADSIYDDAPAERYQFPAPYLDRAKSCIGEWIVYYEPVKVRRSKGYFAMARVQEIIPDPLVPKMYIAVIEPGSFLEFANPVPFKDGSGEVFERDVVNPQWSVRALSRSDFSRITEHAFRDSRSLLPRVAPVFDLQEEQTPFLFEQIRERASFSVSRIVRDRVFRQIVLRAYDERCAISGLKLKNGGGRAEVAAAHIRPVEANGPDSVNNGIALSGTVHWMFDRGLLSLSKDLDVLVSRQVNDPDGVRTLINPTGRAIVPAEVAKRPHPRFLEWHRENCFKQ